MTPKRFLFGGGIALIILGVTGLFGILGQLSDLAFFHPPHWINWVHFLLGLTIFSVSFTRYEKFQGWLVVFPAIIATMMGVVGLLFGSHLAQRFDIPELADPSDHSAHLVVGLLAIWAWRNRTK